MDEDEFDEGLFEQFGDEEDYYSEFCEEDDIEDEEENE